MIITVKTDSENGNYLIENNKGSPSNDEICRAIALLKIIEQQLIDDMRMELEVYG